VERAQTEAKKIRREEWKVPPGGSYAGLL